MQTIVNLLALLLTGVLLQAQNTIEVTMSQFSSNDGKVRVALYNTAESFLEKPFRAFDASIENNTSIGFFENLPDGTYAISCFHDEDNNNQMNLFMGFLPAEDYGCSNGAKGFMGPPKWEDAKFDVKDGEVKAIAIKL